MLSSFSSHKEFTMNKTNRWIGAGLTVMLLLATACASVAPNVPVRGDSRSVRALVGSWEGVYSSAVTGRSGIISFQLRAETDTAQGEVFMIPRSDREQFNMPPDDVANRRTAPASLLTIRFVRAANDELTGVLDPYPDPVCACTLTTRFVGRLRGEEIKGTFTSTGSGIFHGITDGVWSVRKTTTARPVKP